MAQSKFPYELLGKQLRRLRERKNESVAEVSGAVEIDIDQLALIEQGTERPTEDILMLLINHFDAKDDTADKLWEMAGYIREQEHEHVDTSTQQPAVMVLPIDARIVYSDTVNVMVNNYGVVMNFMQNAGPNNQPIAISRIGMSKEHARSVIEVLTQTLAQSEQKHLPPHNDSQQNK